VGRNKSKNCDNNPLHHGWQEIFQTPLPGALILKKQSSVPLNRGHNYNLNCRQEYESFIFFKLNFMLRYVYQHKV
jgi:hypothetical protein